MTVTYEMTNKTDLHASLAFYVFPRNWIIVGNLKGSKRPFKVKEISGRVYLSKDSHGSLSVVPEVSIQGYWANSTGTKWNERTHWWGWGNEKIDFHGLPVSIKENIYIAVEKEAREFLLHTHAEYKELTANRGFKDKPGKQHLAEEEGDGTAGVFMPTVSASNSHKWENMDVSAWSIARKELGLPKPPRKRKAKV